MLQSSFLWISVHLAVSLKKEEEEEDEASKSFKERNVSLCDSPYSCTKNCFWSQLSRTKPKSNEHCSSLEVEPRNSPRRDDVRNTGRAAMTLCSNALCPVSEDCYRLHAESVHVFCSLFECSLFGSLQVWFPDNNGVFTRRDVFWADVKHSTIGRNVKFWRRRQKTTARCWSDKMPLEGNCLSLHEFLMAIESKWCRGSLPRRQNALAQVWVPPQRERHFPSGWGQFGSISPCKCVNVPFYHWPGPVCLRKESQVCGGHFVTGQGQFASERTHKCVGLFCHCMGAVCHGKQQKCGGKFSLHRASLPQKTTHVCVCVGGGHFDTGWGQPVTCSSDLPTQDGWKTMRYSPTAGWCGHSRYSAQQQSGNTGSGWGLIWQAEQSLYPVQLWLGGCNPSGQISPSICM